MPTFETTDGVTLHYLDEGAGAPVVLVGGYAVSADTWALTSDALLAAGYRVIALDRRSHGASESPLHGQRMSRHGADLAELLRTLGLSDAVLVGGSMGASTIWALVDLFGTAGIRGIVTVDQTPKMMNTAEWPHGFYGLDESNVGTFFADGIPDTGRGRRIDAAMPGVLRLIERLGGMPAAREANAPETVRLLWDHAVQDWRDVLERLDVPFLMIAGERSQLWPNGHALDSVARNPLGRAAIVAGAGHATNFDAPDAVNALLLAFLSEL